jgi:acid phosphatase type 7
VGNHEYLTAGASGYFGAAAGPPGEGYYFDAGDLHVVVLNSMCERVGGCGAGSPMMGWLRNDLAANASQGCTLVYFHHPSSARASTATRPRCA